MSGYSNYLGAKKCCTTNLAKTVTGPQGAKGSQGAIGPYGQQGATGAKGDKGATGPCCRGPQGYQGYIGEQGAQGYQGYQGYIGEQGYQGYQGYTGAQGYQGSEGPAGGAGLVLYYNYNEIPIQSPWPTPPPDIFPLQREIFSNPSTNSYVDGDIIYWRLDPNVTYPFTIRGGTYESIIYASSPDNTGKIQIKNIYTGESTPQQLGYNSNIVDVTSTVNPIINMGTIDTGPFVFDPINNPYFTLEIHITGNVDIIYQDLEKYSNISLSTPILVQGPTGAQGYQGATGAQGYQGYTGEQGFQGYTGAQGFQGYTGAQGYQGYTGAQGFQGYTGAQGFQGYTGAQGFQGYTGAQGKTGAQGFQGYTGAQGFQGSTGIQGRTGAQGFQGYTGAQGFQGSTGIQGRTGAQGFQGYTGAQGYQGYQGYTGVQGATGAQGATGPAGPGGALGSYAAFGSTAVQSAAVGATAFFNNFYIDGAGSNYISLTTTGLIANDTIQISNPGTYNIQFSAQVTLPSGNINNSSKIYIWLEQNGSTVPYSNTSFSYPVNSTTTAFVTAWNWFITTTSINETFRIVWSTTDADIKIQSVTNTYGPNIPSILLTVQQVMYTQIGPTGPQGATGFNPYNNYTVSPGITGPTYTIPSSVNDPSYYNYYQFDTTSNAINITLPAISSIGPPKNMIVNITDIGGNLNSNPITIYTSNPDTVSGSTGMTLGIPYSSATLVSNTSDKWLII